MRAASGSEPIREPEEIFLVDRVQHRDGRSLDDLVFQCGHRQGALPAIRLRNVPSPGRQCPVCSPVGSRVQILEIALEVCLVLLPRQPVRSGCGILLKLVERLFEQFDTDVMEERGELLLLPFPCDSSYAVQRT